MARLAVPVFLLLALCVVASPALARKSAGRRLNSGYPTSGSSPSSGSSPVVSTPSTPAVSPPYSSSPSSGSSPSSSTPSSTPTTPTITVPPVTSTPSPVTIPPVTSTPSGGYGGYGSRSGQGTSGFLGRNPGRVPRILSLVSTLAKLFGPRLLKFFTNRKAPSVLGALKDTSTLAVPSLAREATASLVNANLYQDFPLSSAQVVSQFNAALDSPEAAAQQALVFQHLNEGV